MTDKYKKVIEKVEQEDYGGGDKWQMKKSSGC